jgi:transcriptional regulator with XRE-family HTH domain
MAIDEVGLGRSLQRARQAAGLTQQELCQRAGISYSTLAKIERGAIKAPSIFTIQNIATALGVALSDLLPQTNQPATIKQRAKSGVNFVYFDINGCLVRFFHRAFTKLATDCGAPADVIETTFWHYNDAVCRGELSLDDFNRQLASKIGLKTLDWKAYYLEAIDPIKEMHSLVAWAASLYDVGLLSNIMPGFIPAMQSRGDLPQVNYASIVDSSEVGAIKPEAKIYDIATRMANREPSDILLVDDSRANLMAAERKGWHVLWFDDYRPDESALRIRSALEPANLD